MRESRFKNINTRYALPNLPSGACVEAETRTTVYGLTEGTTEVIEADRVDFDEICLPKDSWVADLAEDEFGSERITIMRSGRLRRYGSAHRQFKLHWKGYGDPSWVDGADLKCGALIQEWDRERVSKNRFEVMPSHEEYMHVSDE